MKIEERKSILANIASLKKDLKVIRIKVSSGEAMAVKDYKSKKKEVARLFTQLNVLKAQYQGIIPNGTCFKDIVITPLICGNLYQGKGKL